MGASYELQLTPPANISHCVTFLPVGILEKFTDEQHLSIIAGTSDGEIKLWNPDNDNSIDDLGGKKYHNASVTSIDTAASRIYSADANGVIIIWGAKGKESLNAEPECNYLSRAIVPLRTIDIQREVQERTIVTKIICSNRALFMLSRQGQLNVFDLTTQRVVPARYNPEHICSDMCLSPDGSMVAASDGSHVYIWGAYEGILHEKHTLPVVDADKTISCCLHWNPNMHLLAFCRTGLHFPLLLFGKEQ